MAIPKCSCRFATIIYKKRILMKIQSLLFTMLVAVLSFAQSVPTITSFSPTSGPVGTTVTITGTNFSTTAANNIVYFDGVKATVSAATATTLSVTLPAGTTSAAEISVLKDGLICNSKGKFNITYNQDTCP